MPWRKNRLALASLLALAVVDRRFGSKDQNHRRSGRTRAWNQRPAGLAGLPAIRQV